MTVDVVNGQNQKVGSLDLRDEVFGGQVKQDLIWMQVRHENASMRSGTHATKTRGLVSGSGRKPWRQKGTGRARVGETRNPLWRKGGTIFGPHPRDFSYHMPRTAKRVALRTALFGKMNDGELVLATLPAMSAPSSKAARKVLADLGSPRRALVVLSEPNVNVWKSFRNFPNVMVKTAADLNARDVVNGGTVIAERAAMTALANRVGTDKTGGAA